MTLIKPIFILFRDEIDSRLQRAFSKRFCLHLVPVLKFEKRKLGTFSSQPFDFLLITSQTTLKMHRRFPKAKRIVLMGSQTAQYWRGRRPSILNGSSSKDILRYFARRKSRGSIYFARSALGDPRLPEALRKLGYRVTVRHAYQTRILPPVAHLKKITQMEFSSLFLGFLSPSGVEAVRRSGFWRALMKRKPIVIAIGETTSKALSQLRVHQRRAQKPGVFGILKAAEAALKNPVESRQLSG